MSHTFFSKYLLIVFLFFSPLLAKAQFPLVKILEDELKYEFEALSKADPPVYYLDYRVVDQKSTQISSSFGKLIFLDSARNRSLHTTVRVGDYHKDNTRANGGEFNYFGSYMGGGSLPLDDNKLAVAEALWSDTQGKYRTAVENYKKIDEKVDTAKTDDFSHEKPIVDISKPKDFSKAIDAKVWSERVKKLSALFENDDDVMMAVSALEFTVETKYFVSSEGTKIVEQSSSAYLMVAANIRTSDGQVVPMYKTFFAFLPQDLPTEEEMLAEISEMRKMLIQLKTAPLAEPYTGPAILHPEVSGVFFHEIFGHRIEGHRLKLDSDGQTFKSKVGESVLPASMSVISDPGTHKIGNTDLIGSYKYDDQGVKGQRVEVVNKGKLKTFLMSRTPIGDFNKSNGHGRAQPGLSPVSRQSNLIIKTDNPVSDKQLREMLIEECKKQGKEYGYYFREVTGGFTLTDRNTPNAFNIMPTVVYKVYVDGREDELVRGVDLIGTPLSMFAEITAAGDKAMTFTGICGAESGGVPVSATAPALFVRRIETQKKAIERSGEEPLLPRPRKEGNHE